MDRDSYTPPIEDAESGEHYAAQEEQPAEVISIEQLRRLVRLLDQSSVSELELRRVEEGTRLVLRKAKADQNAVPQNGALLSPQSVVSTVHEEAEPAPSEIEHKVLAHLVGTFHVWARPRGGTLVAVGDRVKEGQLLGIIESLNVFNEVEAPAAGRVVEIFVHEGQPVEYGQVLMTIASPVEE
ncbi:MAG TPA: biotin/lipoyl-containing protein [Ktedonobacteraceae bacterium]|nr:biotin/lipoyl-containing protein [Ktedonobacteraceae bacterium]